MCDRRPSKGGCNCLYLYPKSAGQGARIERGRGVAKFCRKTIFGDCWLSRCSWNCQTTNLAVVLAPCKKSAPIGLYDSSESLIGEPLCLRRLEKFRFGNRTLWYR